MPAMVAMTVASRDTSSVIYTLCMMRRFWNSCAYQWREKPFHTLELVPALKENTIRMMMGAYKNRPVRIISRRLPAELALRCLIASPPVLHPRRSGSLPAYR